MFTDISMSTKRNPANGRSIFTSRVKTNMPAERKIQKKREKTTNLLLYREGKKKVKKAL